MTSANSKAKAARAANNIPLPPTAFIGREKDVAAACEMLRQVGVRLLTFTGPGGTGKTRLSIEVAGQLLPDFPDGVFFVALASISDPALVATSIAQTLGVIESGDKPLSDGLKTHLRGKSLLLILDNFEQVTDAAPLVADLLAEAPELKALVTSRTRLRLRGEREYPVPSLTLPDPKQKATAEQLSQYEAVRLFIERATAIKPDFEVNDDNAPAVAEICARLDGLPLAIELAAARVKMLAPQTMLARLENRLKLLTVGDRDLPERHQTLRNAIEWSYDLLNEEEKTLFRRLAVFSGSRSLDAIEAVCEAGLKSDLLDTAASLVDQNLLQQTPETDSEARFIMLETIQEYAREKLEESGEAEVLGQKHAEYFLTLAERAEAELRGPKQVEWLNRLEVEHDNLRAATKWANEQRNDEIALSLGAALLEFWKTRGHITEGRKRLEMALANSSQDHTSARARAIMAAGSLAWVQGDILRAKSLLEESLDLFRELGDKVNVAVSLRSLGNQARHLGDFDTAYSYLQEGLRIARELGDKLEIAVFLGDLGIVAQALDNEGEARSYYEESLSIRRQLRDKRGVAMTLVNLGELARASENYDSAYSLYHESLGLARELGDKWGVGMVLHNLGHVAKRREDYDQAYELFSESLRTFYEMRNKRDIAYSIAAIAGIYGTQGQPEKAAMLFSAAQNLFNTISGHLDPADLIEFERDLAATKAQISPDDWAHASAKGQSMSLEEAVVFALERTSVGIGDSEAGVGVNLQPSTFNLQPSTPKTGATKPLKPHVTAPLESGYPAGLSEREVEVLKLVATGLTDPEVADKLFISRRTVNRHVSSIYFKLGVTTRTAAAMRAAELHLV